jgi:vacuole morphology and inheritance protein 14
LDILCEIAKFREEYIELILCKLLEKLCYNKVLLNSKGLVILKNLCSVLPVTRVYLKFADALLKMKDYEFIANMLNILDIFLLTYKETEPLRQTLRTFRNTNANSSGTTEESKTEVKEFFEKIFTAWSFNPVSTLTLCMISEYFELSYFLILKL